MSSPHPNRPTVTIPPLGPDGHLPLGRYSVGFEDVYARFVVHPDFHESTTRRDCWDGLSTYLRLWAEFERKLEPVLDGSRLALCVWLGGSFVSARLDPNNVDLTLFVEADVLDEGRKNRLGVSNPLKSLSCREKILKDLRVSPIIIGYRYFRSPFPGGFDPTHTDYLQARGGFDDWWSRARPNGQDKQAPSRETGQWKRGYLEVML